MKQAREARQERLIYCSGLNWEGDGSKDSACRFGASMKSTVERFKCSHCATGQTPEGIFAGPNGIKKSDPNYALNKEEQVSQTEETPAPESEEPVRVSPIVEGGSVEPVEEKEVAEHVVETEVKAEPVVKKQRVAKRRKKRRRF